jgi:hypothetical protein
VPNEGVEGVDGGTTIEQGAYPQSRLFHLPRHDIIPSSTASILLLRLRFAIGGFACLTNLSKHKNPLLLHSKQCPLIMGVVPAVPMRNLT